MTDINHLFRLLREAQEQQPGTHLRDAEIGRADERAAVVLENDGTLALYLEADPSAKRGIEEQAKAFVLELRNSSAFPSGAALMVRLADNAFEDQFLAMVEAFAARTDAEAPLVDVLRQVVRSWRLAFKGKSAKLLSDEEQIGLIAELHLLEALFKVPGFDALEAWHYGDETSRHDFTSTAGDIEVKATKSREEFSLSIHGLEQLTEPEGLPLFLYAEQFELSPDGESLPDAIERVIAAGCSRPLLEDKLEHAGYLPADAPEYERRFALIRSRARQVDDGVPRLSRSYLPNPFQAEQLKSVSYTIDFGPVEGCVENEEAAELLRAAMQE